MGSSDRSSRSALSPAVMLLVLALGAVVGIGVTAALLGRQDRLQADDPDAPLFI